MLDREKDSLIKEFSLLYPEPKSELKFKNNFQLIISVMLSAQCTDKMVNQVTPSLFKQYPNFSVLSKAKLDSIEKIIRPINYYKTKSKHLIETAIRITENFSGRVPRSHAELTSLPGVGQKTANVVLNELGVMPTFPVDTHVFRVSKRLGLAHATKHAQVEEELKATFEPEFWQNLHHWLILHGRRICKARNPLCAECTLNKLCPSART